MLDKFVVIHNPDGIPFMKWEVFCKGERYCHDMAKVPEKTIQTWKVGSYKSEDKANAMKAYWESLQDFREGV